MLLRRRPKIKNHKNAFSQICNNNKNHTCVKLLISFDLFQIWDLRAGKMMTEFHDHGGPVYDVEFHPHEFLLASASADRTVNFWDLESFNLISKSEKDTGPVRYLCFKAQIVA